MNKSEVMRFVSNQKTAMIGSVNEEGYPVVRAMLAPRLTQEDTVYFTTNTSSKKVQQFLANPNASVYFYRRGLFDYKGLCLMGKMEVCSVQPTKDAIWRAGDTVFYKGGATDPDYCVLKFKCRKAEYYRNMKTQTIEF